MYRHKENDYRMFRLVSAQLIDSGSCRNCEIVASFGVSKSSVQRCVKKYRSYGAASFFKPRKSSPRSRVMSFEVLKSAQTLLDEGHNRSEVSDELNIKRSTLCKAINDGRLVERSQEEAMMGSTKSERSHDDAQAADGMGTACTRMNERTLAAFGMLSGASIRFENCQDVPFGGVLCALGFVLSNGLELGINKLKDRLSGYYNALHILLLLSFMALCRIPTAEQLRGKSPGEFGKLMGL